MAYHMVATAVTLNDLEGHSPLADVFKCNPSNICVAFCTISTDSMLACFLCSSRASCFNTGVPASNNDAKDKSVKTVHVLSVLLFCTLKYTL